MQLEFKLITMLKSSSLDIMPQGLPHYKSDSITNEWKPVGALSTKALNVFIL